MQNNKREEKEDKACIDKNRHRQLNEMSGDNEEIEQMLCDAVINDDIHKEKIASKKIEKKMEPYHIDILQMCNLNETIKIFADIDKKKCK